MGWLGIALSLSSFDSCLSLELCFVSCVLWRVSDNIGNKTFIGNKRCTQEYVCLSSRCLCSQSRVAGDRSFGKGGRVVRAHQRLAVADAEQIQDPIETEGVD